MEFREFPISKEFLIMGFPMNGIPDSYTMRCSDVDA